MINNKIDLQIVHHTSLIVTLLHATAEGIEASVLSHDTKIDTNEQMIGHILSHLAQLHVSIASHVAILSAAALNSANNNQYSSDLSQRSNEEDDYESFGVTSYE